MPPLPPSKLDERLLLICIVLGLLLAAAGAKILRLQEQLEAKPVVQDHVVYKRILGPTRVEVRTITKPGGEKIVERVRIVEKTEIRRETEHSETPVAPRPRTRYLGVGVDPLNYARVPRVRTGVTLWNTLDAGLSYDARFSPVAGAVSLEMAYRF